MHIWQQRLSLDLQARRIFQMSNWKRTTLPYLTKYKILIHVKLTHCYLELFFQDMAPYKPGCMLLQVKGRRICQTRLVEPCKESVNSGDAYILVTPKEIFNWVGEFSNVIERSRSADVALTIFQKRDLGCKTARRVTTIEEEKVSSGHVFSKSFWNFLGCQEPPTKVRGFKFSTGLYPRC